ncbi:hypothetical protein TWF506_005888 [Arthrobotrys conoides]|uniref:GPI inositol-deacylase winged helix domain-containing protein n=1 Tax=Arthrobotrys conoides TaxID=74498 RepID=A0AAN8NEX9_9PEZI
MTSRFIPEIMKEFENFPSLEIRASSEDIMSYLDGCFDGSQLKLRFSSIILRDQNLMKKEIKRMITDFVDGMFLLAQLYVKTFEGKMTVKDVRAALKEIQKCDQASTEAGKLRILQKAYDTTMERIKKREESYQLAKNVLQWIVCSRRPLQILELQHALGVEIDKHELDDENIPHIEDVVSVCAGLIVVDKESNVVRLVHYTAQEYFERSKDHWFSGVETYIAATCLSYLSSESFVSGRCQNDEEAFREYLHSFDYNHATIPERENLHHFYDYATKNWGYHAQKSSGLDSKVIEFLEDEAKVKSLTQAMMFTGPVRRKEYIAFYGHERPFTTVKGLHLAAFFGLGNVASEMISRASNLDLDLADGHSRTLLSWAVGNGQTVIGELLIKNGAEVDLPDIDGRTPLLWAAAGGHLTMMELLIRMGANVNATDIFGVTALHTVARRTHLKAISFLLDNGADENIKDLYGGTPLAWAIENDTNTAAQMLLKTHISVDYTYVSFGPRKASLDSRIFSRINVDGTNGPRQQEFYYDMPPSNVQPYSLNRMYGSPDHTWSHNQCLLLRAVGKQDETLVRLLIAKGSRPDLEYSKDQDGRSLLSKAAEEGNRAIVELLIQNGADIEPKDSEGCTPFCWAAKEGHEEVVRFLLAQPGIDLEVKVGARYYGDRGRTPLSYAAEAGHVGVVKLLLETGRVDLDPVRPRAGRTPLSYAAKGGHVAVAQMLLATGRVDPDSMRMASGADRIRTPLPSRSKFWYNRVSSVTSRTPLSYAAEYGHIDVVKLLLETEGVDPDYLAYDKDQTPLSYAAQNGHGAVVELLLATGRVDPDSRATRSNLTGRTPLSIASEQGHEAVVKCLLSKKVNPDSLSIPACEGYWLPHYWIVCGGRTPLSYAAAHGHENIVKLLLRTGKVDASLEDGSGRKPLSYAVEHGHETVAGYLSDNEDFSGSKEVSSVENLLNGQEQLRLGQCLRLERHLWDLTHPSHQPAILQLFDECVDINLGDGIKQILLYYASRCGHETIVERLLDSGLGADFEEYELDSDKRTPLSYAAEGGHEKIVELLLKAGVEADLKDQRGRTPLSHAAQAGHEAIVKLLLGVRKFNTELGSTSCDSIDIFGKTELAHAAEKGSATIVRLLLQRGFNPDAGDSVMYDHTPLALAAENGHDEVVKILLEESSAVLNRASGPSELLCVTQRRKGIRG